jgi:hypothetical protein
VKQDPLDPRPLFVDPKIGGGLTALRIANGEKMRATGGSLNGPGGVVAGEMLFVNSGYARLLSIPGNVLLAFSVDGK